MPTAILLLGLVFVAGATVALLFALGVVGQSSKNVRGRLADLKSPATGTDSAIGPALRAQSSEVGLLRFVTTATAFSKIQRNVLLAGRPDGWTVPRVILYKVVGTSTGVLTLIYELSGVTSLVNVATGLLAVGIGYFAPDILIQRRAVARQASIQQDLPDVLDQVTLSIESGLGFEAAFSHIGDRRTGPLAEEIVRTVQDMRLGMSRREAYQALAERTDVEDMRRFVKGILQAEEYGVSIASVVRSQALEMRFSRRKRAEAQALKVPVKILFPLLTCMFPVLFIVILTPAFINISTIF